MSHHPRFDTNGPVRDQKSSGLFYILATLIISSRPTVCFPYKTRDLHIIRTCGSLNFTQFLLYHEIIEVKKFSPSSDDST